ncbi:protein DCL, chloroplastic [Iris pallida]|uniref:Protein DCL, chloroplastic n=1 Tax=Iris pallida TaxID=29817 RepID=A0AAX6DHK3_IRIPA|nr:protein DCL, chloroplastic [Iris pallida]KAJ6849834.1 protein DCL, chloroplastic [Iris pallida]
MASPTVTLLLHRALPLLRSRAAPFRRCSSDAFSALEWLSAAPAGEAAPPSSSSPTAILGGASATPPKPPKPPIPVNSWADHPDFRRWKEKEEEILSDIEPITLLAKEILHSDRYQDGERLSDEDEKEVVEKLLNYHPHSEDKIGCGLDSLMVDRHPTFRNSRCLFVIRTDGGWIDFSYQKCLRAYIRQKYPSHAEKFIREHFKRT